MARRRVIAITVVALLVLAAGIAVGGVLYVRGVKPDYDQSISTSGVQAPVEVWRDSAGVPHIWAGHDNDLYFAQGYAHAQERLWQMELFRRVAEGRLSEVLGESLIDTDKFLRTIGLWRAAALNESLIDARLRPALASYAAGVNHWIDTHEGPLPPEFIVLRIKPEPWTVRHTLAIEKVMAWDLAMYQSAVNLTSAARTL